MFVSSKTVFYAFIVTVAIQIITINGANIDRIDANREDVTKQEDSSLSGSVSSFFSDMNDGLKNRMKVIRDSFENGYKYVKNKLSTETKNATVQNNAHESEAKEKLDEDRITFKNEDGSVQKGPVTQDDSMSAPKVPMVDDKIVEQVPIAEKKKEEKVPLAEDKIVEQVPIAEEKKEEKIPLAEEDNAPKVPLATDAPKVPLEHTEVPTSVTIVADVANSTDVFVDDRTALQAPEMCGEGEKKIDGTCRKVSDF